MNDDDDGIGHIYFITLAARPQAADRSPYPLTNPGRSQMAQLMVPLKVELPQALSPHRLPTRDRRTMDTDP